MKTDNAQFEIGQTVFRKTDRETPGIITGILFRSTGPSYYARFTNELEETAYWDVELTDQGLTPTISHPPLEKQDMILNELDRVAETNLKALRDQLKMQQQFPFRIGQHVWVIKSVSGKVLKRTEGIVMDIHSGFSEVDIKSVHGGAPLIVPYSNSDLIRIN